MALVGSGLESHETKKGHLQSSHASARRINTLVYMRKITARVPKATHRVMVKVTKTSRLGGSWKLGSTPAGGLMAGPSSSVRSAA